jgi:hypothetical protein
MAGLEGVDSIVQDMTEAFEELLRTAVRRVRELAPPATPQAQPPQADEAAEAAVRDVYSKFNSVLTCIICSERVGQPETREDSDGPVMGGYPVTLGCGHSFCCRCLQEHVDTKVALAPRKLRGSPDVAECPFRCEGNINLPQGAPPRPKSKMLADLVAELPVAITPARRRDDEQTAGAAEQRVEVLPSASRTVSAAGAGARAAPAAPAARAAPAAAPRINWIGRMVRAHTMHAVLVNPVQ